MINMKGLSDMVQRYAFAIWSALLSISPVLVQQGTKNACPEDSAFQGHPYGRKLQPQWSFYQQEQCKGLH